MPSIFGWNKRDLDLGLRDNLAGIIASIISGAENAAPTQEDYALADDLRNQIHVMLDD
jgi:hypothetical protein